MSTFAPALNVLSTTLPEQCSSTCVRTNADPRFDVEPVTVHKAGRRDYQTSLFLKSAVVAIVPWGNWVNNSGPAFFGVPARLPRVRCGHRRGRARRHRPTVITIRQVYRRM